MNRLYLLFAAVVFAAVFAGSGFAQNGSAPAGVSATGWVVVPINEYETLHRKAFPPDREPDPPPVEATLTRVDYELHVDGLLASGRATLTVDVLKDGWVRVPIPAGLLIKEAQLAGKAISLVPMPGNPAQLSAVLAKKGRSILTLDLSFPVILANGEERLALPAGTSGITRGLVTMAQNSNNDDLDLRVSGGFLSDSSAAKKKSPQWLAYGRGGNEPLVFAWRKKVEDRRVELPLRMHGSLTQYFALGEDSTALNAEAVIDVTQGSARQVKFAVPDAVTINQVPGAAIADWDVQAGVLIVNFLEPVERSTRFTITGETKLPRDGAVAIPLLRLLDSERDAGGVAVDVIGAGELKETKPQGLEEVDAADLGLMVASHQSPSLAAFRIRPASALRSLSVNVARYAQQAVLTANVEEARYRILLTAEGKTLVEARYAVRNNQRNFVKITLPMGAVVWSSSLAGRPVRAGQSPDGSLLFPLAKAGAGEEASLAAIQILYVMRGTAWQDKGREMLTLPSIDLPASKAGVLLYYPPQFRVTPSMTGAFQAQPYERPGSAALSSNALNSAPALLNTVAKEKASTTTQALVDKFRARTENRRTGAALPATVSFPAVGPSLYLASQLSEEGKMPGIELTYQKDKKGDAR